MIKRLLRPYLNANFMALGVQRLWRGMRTNDAQMVAVGLGMVLLQQYRMRKPGRVLVHSQSLKPGDEVTIKVDPR